MARRPVLWIIAPAGAGKTVAVSSYLAARSIHPLWYSLDQHDKTPPSSFWLSARLAAHRRPTSRRATMGPRSPTTAVLGRWCDAAGF
jgi:ATP/maltotriose-dependent transcriptional regulator MalT